MASRKHQPAKTGNVLFIVLGALVIAAVGALVFMRARGPSGEGVTLSETRLESTASGGRAVAGTLHNNTRAPFEFVEIGIDLLRPDGSVLGQTVAMGNNLGGLETQKFEAPILDPAATRFRIARLTCKRESRDPDAPPGQKPLCALDHPIELP